MALLDACRAVAYLLAIREFFTTQRFFPAPLSSSGSSLAAVWNMNFLRSAPGPPDDDIHRYVLGWAASRGSATTLISSFPSDPAPAPSASYFRKTTATLKQPGSLPRPISSRERSSSSARSHRNSGVPPFALKVAFRGLRALLIVLLLLLLDLLAVYRTGRATWFWACPPGNPLLAI